MNVDDVLMHIFSFLHPTELVLTIPFVCKRWKTVVHFLLQHMKTQEHIVQFLEYRPIFKFGLKHVPFFNHPHRIGMILHKDHDVFICREILTNNLVACSKYISKTFRIKNQFVFNVFLHSPYLISESASQITVFEQETTKRLSKIYLKSSANHVVLPHVMLCCEYRRNKQLLLFTHLVSKRTSSIKLNRYSITSFLFHDDWFIFCEDTNNFTYAYIINLETKELRNLKFPLMYIQKIVGWNSGIDEDHYLFFLSNDKVLCYKFCKNANSLCLFSMLQKNDKNCYKDDEFAVINSQYCIVSQKLQTDVTLWNYTTDSKLLHFRNDFSETRFQKVNQKFMMTYPDFSTNNFSLIVYPPKKLMNLIKFKKNPKQVHVSADDYIFAIQSFHRSP